MAKALVNKGPFYSTSANFERKWGGGGLVAVNLHKIRNQSPCWNPLFSLMSAMAMKCNTVINLRSRSNDFETYFDFDMDDFSITQLKNCGQENLLPQYCCGQENFPAAAPQGVWVKIAATLKLLPPSNCCLPRIAAAPQSLKIKLLAGSK